MNKSLWITGAVAVAAVIGVGAWLARDSGARATTARDAAIDVARAAADGAPTGQRSALADGQVTWDEHEAAIQATAACLSVAGFNAEVTPSQGAQPSTLGFSVASLSDGPAAEAALNDCKARHLDAIEALWLAQNTPSQGQIQEAFNFVARCMNDQGIAVRSTDSATAQDYALWRQSPDPKVAEASLACVLQRKAALGY